MAPVWRDGHRSRGLPRDTTPWAAGAALRAALLAASFVCPVVFGQGGASTNDKPSGATPTTKTPSLNGADGTGVQPGNLEIGADDPDESEADLVLKDGRQVNGVVIEKTPDHVILRINGIVTPFPAEDIVSTEIKPPVSQRYREMRAAIDDSDIEQRLRLVEWLRGRRKYTLALNEVTGVLSREPDNPEGLRLQNWLNEQLKLRRAAQAKAAAKNKPEGGKETPFPLLNAAEINLMRVYEVELGDPPRMLVDPEAIRKMVETYAASPLIPATAAGREGLYRKRPAQILEMMFKLQARELYSLVQVQEDPASVRLFRERVHSTWLMNACATNQCHGGEEAGRLWLATKRPNSDASVYTNLLILDRFRVPVLKAAPGEGKPGVPATGGTDSDKKVEGAKGTIPLIDYEDPAKSPLLQMGLPRTRSLYPHPEVGGRPGVRGFTPIFQTVDDRRFEDAIAWIRAMYHPRPVYPIDYVPPQGSTSGAEAVPESSPREAPKPR